MLIYFYTGFLSNDIKDYWYVSQGKLTVPSIDDKEDMQFADEAFDILGFSTQMKYDVFKNTACMMHMGNMTKDFVPVGKEEQAEVKVSMVMVTRSSDLIFLCLRMRPILIRLLNFSASTVYPFLIALSIFHPFS